MLLDYLLIVRLFRPPDGYLYYALTFAMPLVAGSWKTSAARATRPASLYADTCGVSGEPVCAFASSVSASVEAVRAFNEPVGASATAVGAFDEPFSA